MSTKITVAEVQAAERAALLAIAVFRTLTAAAGGSLTYADKAAITAAVTPEVLRDLRQDRGAVQQAWDQRGQQTE